MLSASTDTKARFCARVAAEGLDVGAELRVGEEGPERCEQRVVDGLGPQDEVVRLVRDRDEVEPERAGGGADAHAGVGAAGGDGSGHGKVGVLLTAVALDRV